jgi:hypothetical protein
MIPKEKAYQIYDKIANVTDGLDKYPMCYDTAKQCALIVVDEIIKSEPVLPNKSEPFSGNIKSIRECFTDANSYWNEVKEEIEKI